MRLRVRREECLARYGGEEFCIVFPEADGHAAAVRAEELRRACAAHPFEFGGVRLPVTFSGGVAELRNDLNAIEILKRADERLYEAKRAGRNQIH